MVESDARSFGSGCSGGLPEKLVSMLKRIKEEFGSASLQ